MSASARSDGSDLWEVLIEQARQGSPQALGFLLDRCRNYLLVVAHGALGAPLHSKAGSSDLVQETFLQAQKGFAGFTGTTESELLAWLRGILLNNAADFSRRFQDTAKRQVSRELSLDDSNHRAELPSAASPSPSDAALALEQDVALRKALGQLPEEYRQVVEWRNYQGLSFEEVGQRMGRSADAARKLWGRALKNLQDLLGVDDASSDGR